MSKLDILGPLQDIKEHAVSLFEPEVRRLVLVLIDRIEDLEAELSEANAHISIHASLIDAQKIYSDGRNDRILQLEAENKKLRELLDMATKALDSAETMWRSSQPRKLDEALSWRENDAIAENLIANFRAKARECKALEAKRAS